MFIDKNSIVIDGVSMGPYITEAKFGFNKIWSSDSGRNLAGTQTGTLIGIYPKIVLSFQPLTRAQLETITPILDKAHQTVSYYDPTKKAQTTMTTYTGDYEVSNTHIISGTNKTSTFDCSFIAVSKRM